MHGNVGRPLMGAAAGFTSTDGYGCEDWIECPAAGRRPSSSSVRARRPPPPPPPAPPAAPAPAGGVVVGGGGGGGGAPNDGHPPAVGGAVDPEIVIVLIDDEDEGVNHGVAGGLAAGIKARLYVRFVSPDEWSKHGSGMVSNPAEYLYMPSPPCEYPSRPDAWPSVQDRMQRVFEESIGLRDGADEDGGGSGNRVYQLRVGPNGGTSITMYDWAWASLAKVMHAARARAR